MGRHADAGRRRGLARWVITASVVVLLLAAATAGYLVIVNRSDPAADGRCTGAVTLPVAAGTGAAPAISRVATAYNADAPVARSTCVTAAVTAVPDGTALAGLTGSWPEAAGAAPALWVPDDAGFLAAMDAVRPDLAAGHPTDPLAWSPVVLAIRSDDVAATGSLSWSGLPTAAGPQGTAALPGDRHLLLALPAAGQNRATSYLVQSVLAGVAGSTATVDRDAVRTGRDTVRAIGSGAVGSPATTAEGLAALAAGTGGATAVPVVEADLVAYDAAGYSLSAVHPAGPSTGDSLIPAPISAGWVDQTLAAAASSFQAFLGSSQGQQILADAGWRTASAQPAKPVVGVDTTTAVTRLATGGPSVDAAVAAALGQPVPSSPLPPETGTSAGLSGSSSGATSGAAQTTTSPSVPTTPSPTTSAIPTTPSPTTKPGTATSVSRTSTATAGTTARTTASSTANPAASGPVLTIVVDSSSGMAGQVGGKSLLQWVQQGLPTVTGGKITDRVGLRAYADSGSLPPDGYPELVATGPLTATVGTTTRSTALTSAIAGLKPAGDRWAYGALIAALQKAPAAAVAGRADRVVLITSGVDQTPATPRQMVLNAVTAAKGTIRLDVIGLGSAVPAQAYNAIATASGGTYVPVTDPAKLGQALTNLLTVQP